MFDKPSGKGFEHTFEIIIIAIVLIVAVVQILASTVGLVFTSFQYLGSNLTSGGINGSTTGGTPIGSLFNAGGLVGLIFGLIVFLLVLFLLFRMLKSSSNNR